MARFLNERQEVADRCRYFADAGYFAGTGGNIGLRLDERHFAVTPTATDYGSMRAEDVVVLTLDTLQQVVGDRKPSVEKGLHQAMLAANPERRASVHTHQPIASAVALLHETLEWADGVDRHHVGRHIGLIPYRPSGTGMLVKALAKSLRPDVHAYLLASHGVICTAADLAAATDMIRWIEAAAAAHLRRRIEKNNPADRRIHAFVTAALDAAMTKGV